MKVLRLILGDQLNHDHQWYDRKDEDVTYCMFEMHQEATYVKHHIQKVVAFFLAMRAFADKLSSKGHSVIYQSIDDKSFEKSLEERLTDLIKEHQIERFEYQLPDEWRLDQQLHNFCKDLDIESKSYDSEHFLTERDSVSDFFGDKEFLMETFYRAMRKKYDVLMDGDKPETGKWNYDHENRKKLPKDLEFPDPKIFERSIHDIVDDIKERKIETIGSVDGDHFIWPVTREESLDMLAFFVDHCLKYFGKYQDAMTTRGWSLFHSRLSFALNVKLLHPLEVVRRVEAEYKKQGDITIAQAEGFIRQVLGWREYMRGIYWAKMPEFAEQNFFEYQRKIPEFFWTGDTKMACLSHSISQSLEYAYAHHIQRLMVTGNFALLAGVSPDEVDAWYLGIYIDAIEWVEMPNARGMSQFADGGIVGTKPYVSSGSYINKMSHYCKDCHYSVSKKTGEGACPFNSLYWNFIDQNREKLAGNQRMSMMYSIWDKMDEGKQTSLLEQADTYLENLENL